MFCLNCNKPLKASKTNRCACCNNRIRNKTSKQKQAISNAWKEGKYNYHFTLIGKKPKTSYNSYYKSLVYKKLGNKCKRCSFSDIRALQIDHVNDDADYSVIKNRISLFKEILDDTANRFQILCANCNWIKRVENQREGHKS